jgi:CheY-like chemotaxis protein
MDGLARRTILVVEDESAIVEVLAQYLKDEGFSVTSAGDGPSAVAVFHADAA